MPALAVCSLQVTGSSPVNPNRALPLAMVAAPRDRDDGHVPHGTRNGRTVPGHTAVAGDAGQGYLA